MTTPNDLVNDALGDAGVLGVGQSPLPEDSNKAFRMLNQMLYDWNRSRFLVYALTTQSKVSTGAVSYTVGPGGDFDTGTDQRPAKLESVFFRQPVTSSTPVDFHLTPIYSREDYDRISVKELSSFSKYYFYDTAFPLGKIYPWPVLAATVYTLYITHRTVLSQFTSLSQTISLPGEYEGALRYNLAIRLAAHYRIPTTPELKELAKGTRDSLKDSNFQPSTLKMPKALRGLGRGRYNIYSDQGG